jgi:hypothetical protein
MSDRRTETNLHFQFPLIMTLLALTGTDRYIDKKWQGVCFILGTKDGMEWEKSRKSSITITTITLSNGSMYKSIGIQPSLLVGVWSGDLLWVQNNGCELRTHSQSNVSLALFWCGAKSKWDLAPQSFGTTHKPLCHCSCSLLCSLVLAYPSSFQRSAFKNWDIQHS